ncbi:MFS transporter [Cedecea davisae]|uniref:MFS transporter n=1 Tax=Cedecea davisae TaxID=158484 RepID=UPI00242D8B70|nr:MFS transporter [Cedecea davisae]
MALFTSPLIAYRKPHVLGFILYFIVGLVDGAIVPFFPLWAQQSAAIPVEFIGLLFGCYAGGELLAAPFIGGIADRVGRRPVLIISATGVGAGFIALFFAHGVFAVLLMWGLLLGVAGSWVEAIMPLYASNQMGMSAASIGYLFAFGAVIKSCLPGVRRCLSPSARVRRLSPHFVCCWRTRTLFRW